MQLCLAMKPPLIVLRWDLTVDWYRNLSLRTKFASHIAISIILLFSGLIPGVVYLQESAVLDEVKQRGFELTKVFAHASVQPFVMEDDFLVTRQFINSIANESDVSYVMILDPKGQVLAHNDIREVGKNYTDSVTMQTVRSERYLAQELWTSDPPVYDFAVPIGGCQRVIS